MTVITMSRQYGSLGNIVVYALAERLGCRVVMRELINQAALRAGAGYVRLSTPGGLADPGVPTEAVIRELPPLWWASAVAKSLERFHSLVIGPGLGRSDETTAQVREQAAAARDAGVTPLAVLDVTYGRLRPEALANGLVAVQGGRLAAAPGARVGARLTRVAIRAR